MDSNRSLKEQFAICGLFAGVLGVCWPAAPAAAGSPFCPAGFNLINGFCVSPSFTTQPPCPKDYGPVTFGPNTFACVGNSGSAAASQATNTTTRNLTDQVTNAAVRARRDEETGPCPAGTQRVNGVCQAATNRGFAFAPDEAYAADLGPQRMVVRTPPATPGGMQVAVWVQGFGDYEHRSEITPATTPTLGGVPGTFLPRQPGDGTLSTTTDLTRTTWTAGVLGGFDLTYRNVFAGSDVLVIGALGGYTSAHTSFKTGTNTTDLTGPSVGAYAAYVRGPWSADVTFKADFYNEDQKFADFTGGAFAVSGTSSIGLNVYSVTGNLNYKIPIGTNWYFEPTVGVLYSDTVYDSSAAALGLFDTNATRVQGGARIGSTNLWGTTVVTSSLTGLAYSYVTITGGSSAGGAFAGTGTVQSDEGKVFGQFLFAQNYDFGRGYSASFAADVRFGNDLIGVGAKGGLRYQW
jgi:hypothetical protein